MADDLFKAVDKDNSGTITKDEFLKLHRVIVMDGANQMDRVSRAKRNMWLLVGGVVFLVTFLGLSVALNFAVVDELIRTSTDNGRLTDKETGTTVKVGLDQMEMTSPQATAPAALVSSDGNHTVVGMREEKIALPLVVLPVLGNEDLAAVRSLVVTFSRPLFESAPKSDGGGGGGGEVGSGESGADSGGDEGGSSPRVRGVMAEQSAALNIIRAKRYNDTWATLLASSGETVEVKNGRAYLLEEGQPPAKLCLAQTSCSALALRAQSEEDAAALIARAWAALEDRGFGLLLPHHASMNVSANVSYDDPERRRLSLAYFAQRHAGSSSLQRQLSAVGDSGSSQRQLSSDTLTWAGWSPYDFPMNNCFGDCDYDSDCRSGKCYQRNGYETVPGCDGTGYSAADYCAPVVEVQSYSYLTTLTCRTVSTSTLRHTQSITLSWMLRDTIGGQEKWDVIETRRDFVRDWDVGGVAGAIGGLFSRRRRGGGFFGRRLAFWTDDEPYIGTNTLPKFSQCNVHVGTLGASTPSIAQCSCQFWPNLTWSYEDQAWIENCTGYETTREVSDCAEIVPVCLSSIVGRRLESLGNGTVDEPDRAGADPEASQGAEPDWAGQAAGRQLGHRGRKHRKNRKEVNVCSAGTHNCATNLDDYPPCKPACSL